MGTMLSGLSVNNLFNNIFHCLFFKRENQPTVLFLHGFGVGRNWAKYDVYTYRSICNCL